MNLSPKETTYPDSSPDFVKYTLELLSLNENNPKLRHVLNDLFKIEQFREGQEEVIASAILGRNMLVTKPTSWGKSLCYQIPAYLDHLCDKGPTIVISPLISLMREQSHRLKQKGLGVACLDSTLNEREYKQELALLKNPNTCIIYLSPERLNTKKLLQLIERINVARIVIDEAHCISMWGHDFRPTYQRIPEIRAKLNNPPISLFTASAPVVVRDDIIEMVKLGDDYDHFSASPDRPNLKLIRKSVDSLFEKEAALILELRKSLTSKQSTVIYFQRIKDLEDVSELLTQQNIAHHCYHARMDLKERGQSQTLFSNDTIQILLATNAYGMGIDKPNIRKVIHYGLPSSLEQYYQEVGRAGRDGLESNCILLCTHQDIRRRWRNVHNHNPSLESIIALYYRMWDWVKPENLNNELPTIYFDSDHYFVNNKIEDPSRQSLVLTAIATLQEYGLILYDHNRITFLIKGNEVQREEFPISRVLLEQKERRDRLRLKIMIHYLYSEEDPRTIILDHFDHNSVEQQISRANSIHELTINQPLLEHVLALISHKDLEQGDLVTQLIALSSKAEKGIPPYTPHELRAEIEHIGIVGYLRIVKADVKTIISITEHGIKKLEGSEHIRGRITSLDELYQQMHTAQAKEILVAALQDWFENAERCLTGPQSWWDSLQLFTTDQFQILGKEVTGAALVQKFFRRTYSRSKGKNPVKTHAKEMLNYLFDNKIKTVGY